MPDSMQGDKSSGSAWKEYFLQNVVRHEAFTLGIILLVLIAVFAVTTGGKFLEPTNVMNIMVQSSIRGVAAVGQAFVIITAGIDLAIGGIALMAACLGASFMTTMTGYLGPIPMGAALAIMILAGAGVGAINGLSVSRLRMPALIVTLAMWQITQGAASQLTTGPKVQPQVIQELPSALAFFGQGNIGGAAVPIIIFIAVIVVGYFVLNHTTFGKSVYAVGGNEVTAWLSGIKTRNTILWVYVVSGLCAAIAAIIQISRVMVATYAVIANLELDSIAAVVVGGVSLFGGKGNIIGVLLGVLIIGVANNAMNLMQLTISMQDIIKGAIIISAVVIDAWRSWRSGG